MKFSTPMGAFFGKSVQVILPAVVSIIATGSGDAAAVVDGPVVRCGGVEGSGLACDQSIPEKRAKITTRLLCLRIPTPPHSFSEFENFILAKEDCTTQEPPRSTCVRRGT